MSSSQPPGALRVQRSMGATPERAWDLIADITRMGEWSPETIAAAWQGGAHGPAPGARSTGTDPYGTKQRRSTRTLTAGEPGRRFAFHVSIGPLDVADWAYEFEPTDEGCVVTELWEDRRGALVRWLSPAVTGTKDRARRNQETMTVTLDRLATAAENP